MNAGQALGLLAGLGALNALSGGRNGAGKRFTGLLDMIDGGGAGQSGDKFEGGGLLSILGNLFAKPYEAQQRVEEIAARTADRSTSPKPVLRPSPPVSGFDSQTVQDIAAANEDAYLKEAFGLVPEIPSVTPDVYNIGSAGEFGGAMATDNLSKSDVLSGGPVQPMPASSQDANFSGGGLLSSPDLPMREGLPLPRDAEGILAPELPASERNTRLVSFNRRMETVPEMLRGTEIESMYRDYVLNGGLGTFDQFTNQSMATEDPAVARSPTPLAMATPSAIIPPTVPVAPAAPQPQPVSVSDLPYADQVVAARQAVMRGTITPDMLENIFGVDFAREVISGIQTMGGRTSVPNIPLGPLSIQRLHRTMPITRFN